MKIKDKLYERKMRKQRGKKGYAESDLFSLDDYFIKTFKAALTEFKETTFGYPMDITFEEWQEYLDKMIFLLGEMEKIYDVETEKESKYIENCKNEFFNMLKKRFWNLWM